MNGDIWWKYQTGGEIKSSTVVDPVTSLVILGSHDQCLHAVKKKVWCTMIGHSSIFASPCVSSQPHLIVCATLGGIVVALHGTWKFKAEDLVFSSPTVVDNVILIESNDCHFLFEAEQSNELKTDTIKNGTKQKNGKVKKFVTFASTDGYLYIVDFCSGEIVLKHFLSGQIFSSPVVYDNCLVVGCRNDFVYCLSIE
ncbi:AASDH [Mytilus coruscus]|uniref:AASDH n=1 Tax=Mytilus coruscus TaxID=42192 RepID=A0A6J8DWD4_MYTCO|nr:AASDH [Mytilus coruscus]